MPRERKPINLLVLTGKSHMTKAQIEERQNSEVKAPSDNIAVPKYLPKELQLDFKRIAKELRRIDLMSNLDTDSLARFLLAREQYVRTSLLIRETDPVEDVYIYGKLADNNNKFFNQCRAAANDMGLNISARCKLLVPKVKDKEPSEFDRKFGDV